ncbi:MAG: HD domain-containing protein [Planctomycetota bacterium]
MNPIADLPELQGLDRRRHLVRIPRECDVPLTPRVQQIIDTAEFRRLARISQLGLVSLVYPAAHHTRFEHSLGVYRLALLYLKQLAHDERFTALITQKDAERFIAAALLHDLGHWPFCHPIEDMNLSGVPDHELFGNSFLLESEIADTLRSDWDLAPRNIVSLLSEKPRDEKSRFLSSMLSGPVDVDKMDYLPRDSLHAGVPYGRNFDQQRLIGSLCVNEQGNGLAISDKGRTAAEMMVFARYVMFSEVYWHHAVRCATAMLQRAFFLLRDELELDVLFRLDEREMIGRLMSVSETQPAAHLLTGLFGPTRQLYKRWAQFSAFQNPQQYQRLARQPYAWLVTCARNLAHVLSTRAATPVAPHEVLIDAPPIKREVQFNVQIYFPKESRYRSFGDISPVVQTLALQQFDDYVKRVRIFIHPRLVPDMEKTSDHMVMVDEAIEMSQ